MAEITRYTGNLAAFASSAAAAKRKVFADPATASDTIDGNWVAAFVKGWEHVGPADFPTIQDFNAMGFTLAQVLAYLHQRGVPEWDNAQEYYQGAITSKDDVIYVLHATSSTGDDPAADTAYTNWHIPGTSRLTVITSSQTYTPPAGSKGRRFLAIGAGGGSGGVDGQGAGTAAAAAPGAGGGWCEKTYWGSHTSYTVTIGAGGAGAPAGSGGGAVGGNTSVVDDDVGTDVNITANGGNGGGGGTGTTLTLRRSGPLGGTSSGGDVNQNGSSVADGVADSGTPVGTISGSSFFGGGVKPGLAANGTNASNFGEGGGCPLSQGTNTNYAGGDGGDGVVLVEEFF